jgi:uncharacterized membrane protein YqjE
MKIAVYGQVAAWAIALLAIGFFEATWLQLFEAFVAALPMVLHQKIPVLVGEIKYALLGLAHLWAGIGLVAALFRLPARTVGVLWLLWGAVFWAVFFGLLMLHALGGAMHYYVLATDLKKLVMSPLPPILLWAYLKYKRRL